ncbi:hypothetical protein ABZP36_031592 [Zizania latifolia]
MAKSMRVCDARRRSARATSSPPRPRRSPPASSAATWREQMSVDAGAAALEMVRAAGLLRTQGLIGGKWVDGYDGKTVEACSLALLTTLEQGKPMKEALGEVNYGACFVEYFAEEAKHIYGDIIPPTLSDRGLLVVHFLIHDFVQVGPALACGCTVVVKLSEFTPLIALAAADLAFQAGIQSTQVRKITFTGSTAGGKKLLAGSADTVKKFCNSRQTCLCANRIFVQEGIYEKFASAFIKAVQSLQVGNGLQESTSQGPLINEASVQKLRLGPCLFAIGLLSLQLQVAPFGLVKQSGLGKDGSKYGVDEYPELKYICMGNLN